MPIPTMSAPNTSTPWPPTGWPGRATNRHLRVSNAERTEVCELLTEHFGAGRLDEAEFRARLGRAMDAVTWADFDGLLADLPPLSAPAAAPPPTGLRTRRWGGPVPLALVLAVAVALTVGSALSFLVGARIPWLLIVVAALVWRRHRWGRWRGHYRGW